MACVFEVVLSSTSIEGFPLISAVFLAVLVMG